MWTSHVTYEWVMSHIIMRHVTQMNGSCHIWMNHVTHKNETCQTYERDMSHVKETCHIWINESCRIWMRHVTYKWVMSRMNKSYHTSSSPGFLSAGMESWHTWMSHVTQKFETFHTHDWVILHVWMSLVTPHHRQVSCRRGWSHQYPSTTPLSRTRGASGHLWENER